MKKHAIPHGQLHKKTYFNALEKILISPSNLNKSQMEGKKTIHDSVTKAFDDVFKKPPSRLGDDTVRRAQLNSQKVDKAATSTIKVMENQI